MLEDGSLYAGEARGDFRETPCEVVFNTSMTGYVEILTDPSYAGQGIVMTYPMIGNYGVSKEDFESDKLQPCAFLVHELCDTPSNFRNTQTIDSLLKEYGIPCMSGLDTRAVVKKLRESGTMRGVITDDISDKDRLMQVIKDFRQEKLVESVTLREKRVRGEENSGAKIALMDFGTKRNITNNLVKRGCVVTEYPAWTTAEEVLRDKPDGIMLSNGPGDPQENIQIIEEVKKLYQSDVPIFAICLGHQLMALANGMRTYKLKYGHRGGNHPVKDLETGRVYISSQNHGYVVDTANLNPSVAVPAFVNVNDGTNEGLKYTGKNIFTVQYHPEACPGPQDSSYLFDRFLKMMEV